MKPLTFLTYSVIKKGIINNNFFLSGHEKFFGLVKMTFGLVDVGQAVKLIFFAPWKNNLICDNNTNESHFVFLRLLGGEKYLANHLRASQ